MVVFEIWKSGCYRECKAPKCITFSKNWWLSNDFEITPKPYFFFGSQTQTMVSCEHFDATKNRLRPPKIGGLGAQWVLVLSPHRNVVSSVKKKCSPQSVLPRKSFFPKLFFLLKVFSRKRSYPEKVFFPKCSPLQKCSPFGILLFSPLKTCSPQSVLP